MHCGAERQGRVFVDIFMTFNLKQLDTPLEENLSQILPQQMEKKTATEILCKLFENGENMRMPTFI